MKTDIVQQILNQRAYEQIVNAFVMFYDFNNRKYIALNVQPKVYNS